MHEAVAARSDERAAFLLKIDYQYTAAMGK
jgi:hypothetical protein